MGIEVRTATIEDCPEILEQLLMMHREVPFGAINEAKLRKHITHVIDNGIVYVSYAPKTGIVTGSCGFLWSQSLYWSDDWWATEQWVYVREEYRGSESAVSLLKSIRDLANGLCIPVQFGVNSPYDKDLKNKLFRRYADIELGSTFIVNPKEDKNESMRRQ